MAKKNRDGVEVLTMVYIGPSIPRSNLRRSMIIKGTGEDIAAFIAEQKEQYPEIEHLMFEPGSLADALRKVESRGNILHKYFKDMEARAANMRARRG